MQPNRGSDYTGSTYTLYMDLCKVYGDDMIDDMCGDVRARGYDVDLEFLTNLQEQLRAYS